MKKKIKINNQEFDLLEIPEEERKLRRIMQEKAFEDGLKDGRWLKGPSVIKKKIDKWAREKSVMHLYIDYLEGYLKGYMEHIRRFVWTDEDLIKDED